MRILCIGDSNTWGYNPENGQRLEKRWTRLLREMLPEDEIIEEGLCGRTLISMDREKRERCGIDSLNVLLMSHMPVDLVLVMLGIKNRIPYKCTFYCPRGERIYSYYKESVSVGESLYSPCTCYLSDSASG